MATPWAVLSQITGELSIDQRIWVSINWDKVSNVDHVIPIVLVGSESSSVQVFANIDLHG